MKSKNIALIVAAMMSAMSIANVEAQTIRHKPKQTQVQSQSKVYDGTVISKENVVLANGDKYSVLHLKNAQGRDTTAVLEDYDRANYNEGKAICWVVDELLEKGDKISFSYKVGKISNYPMDNKNVAVDPSRIKTISSSNNSSSNSVYKLKKAMFSEGPLAVIGYKVNSPNGIKINYVVSGRGGPTQEIRNFYNFGVDDPYKAYNLSVSPKCIEEWELSSLKH